ncbi:MAG: branched-chain amino acid ABC transporter permease [Cyanobacteria bacterium Co-bin13]|nr:branched-chain amino acid ABC transporter permease [Cyanobacteria bacterium Co-bin13]
MTDFLQLIFYGIVSGSILALGAVGVSLTFGILRFANFAHGDLMTIGAYFAFTLGITLGLPFWLGFVVACGATALTAVVTDKLVFRKLRRRPPVILLISSFGIALIFRSLIQLVWGSNQLVYRQGIQRPVAFAGLNLRPDQITIVLGAVVLVLGLHLFLQYTKTGKAMRAMADNVDLAKVTGIDTERVVTWTWILGAIMACAAGVFLGLDTQINPVMGWRVLLPIFSATILGGIGSPYGAIAGGLVLGLASELSTLFISPEYKAAVAFAILVAMLIVRPTGLFGGR